MGEAIICGKRVNRLAGTGLETNEKIQSQFVTRYENLVAISQILVAKSPRCIVLSAVEQKNMSPQYLCVKKPLRMANDRRNGAVHVTC